jgi:hypothetical protein
MLNKGHFLSGRFLPGLPEEIKNINTEEIQEFSIS